MREYRDAAGVARGGAHYPGALMPSRPRRSRLAQVIPFVLGAAIFAFACGSSSVARVQHAGHSLRWVLLFVLLALAVWAALDPQRPMRLPVSVLATAAALSVVAFVSALWSVDPRLTFERAATLGAMLVTAAALAQVYGVEDADRLLRGVVGGAAAVAIAGLLVLAVRHHDAVEASTRDLPARYQGLGENPNTVPLLLAPCLALVVWLLVRASSRRSRIALAAVALLFDGSIIASGSRGSLIAGFTGIAVVLGLAPLRGRLRAVLVLATVVALAASIGLALTPKSQGAAWVPPPRTHTAPAPGSDPKPGYLNVEGVFPLDSDVGSILVDSSPSRRALFGLTGRGEAWRGAVDLGNERPIAGYGFGTEGVVFVDRWADFVGGLPENSYIGMYLQLGTVGLVTLLALIATLAYSCLHRRDRWQSAGSLAALTAGVILAVVQSYLYSVGDVATLALWTAAFVGSARAEADV